MNKISKTIAVILVFMAVMGSIFAYNNTANKIEPEPYLYNNRNIECLYYNATNFINIPDYETNKDVGTIHGCIIPHHLVAKDLIHEVFQNVKKHEYKTVVLIGPDHESIDKGKIFTTLSNWQTPTGILETDTELTKELLKKYSFIEVNNDKLTMEHSTSSIIPFINYYLKGVNVVTLVLTKQVKLSDVEALTDTLYENFNMEETLFIASIDFSHYLNLGDADKMDLISMEAIKNNDIRKIMSFTNDNLDSPISVVTMLKMMDKLSTEKTVLNRSNSELILKKKTEETTSYITYLFSSCINPYRIS